jgi:DNA methylase
MNDSRENRMLRLQDVDQFALIASARDVEPVSGLTHGFYKYPARFSPKFARCVIEIFTKPGDLVLDPYVGGGTTLVEALASGRDAIGVDISELADFVTGAKTTVYSEAELDTLDQWSRNVAGIIDTRKARFQLRDYAELGYYKHIDHPARWRLRKAIEQSLWSAISLGAARLEIFGRCVVLRTAQWALDGRAKQATIEEFRGFLETTAESMVEGARALRAAVTANGARPIIEVLRRSAAGLEADERIQRWRSPQLVVTSPPYPGVHVLYHRWQVDGCYS